MDDQNGNGNGNGPRKVWYAFEKLEVYHLAVRFRELIKRIVALLPPGFDDDISQVLRSSKSGIRNICEGAGEFSPKEKARFYRMSLRSFQEAGGTLRIIEGDWQKHPLFDEAHTLNYEIIAKMTLLAAHTRKRSR